MSFYHEKPVVCIDSRMVNHSGIGTYLKNIIPHLTDKYDLILLGNSVELACFSVKDIIPLNSKIYTIKEQAELLKKIPKCDIFWSPHYNVPVLPVKAKRRIVTIHDVYHLAYASTLSVPQKLYSKLIMQAAVKFSDMVITVSNFSKSEIVKYTGCDSSIIEVVYNGVSQTAHVINRELVKEKYNIPANYILFVGNVKPHKNLKLFLEAFIRLPKALYDKYNVVIVGKKEGMITGDHELLNWANNNGLIMNKVTFTGHVDDNDLDTIYNCASLFVFPSFYEGFGLPPLEAMLNKCPVVASRTSSIPEVCGDSALYFDPSNAQELTAVMAKVLTDKEISVALSVSGSERISHFKWEKSIKSHIELFESLTNS
jgi:glycosyltransferase involved in cell wall biosynthesis